MWWQVTNENGDKAREVCAGNPLMIAHFTAFFKHMEIHEYMWERVNVTGVRSLTDYMPVYVNMRVKRKLGD